ncbi:hypothetical protein KM043_008570 [Ampulex compressa]|nr:hypothetical protein KM043_008570 [Ampulex compressa]
MEIKATLGNDERTTQIEAKSNALSRKRRGSGGSRMLRVDLQDFEIPKRPRNRRAGGGRGASVAGVLDTSATSLAFVVEAGYRPRGGSSALALPPLRPRGRHILVRFLPDSREAHTDDNWWASVSRFGREVSPGPPTRRSETTTTTKETFGGYTPRPTVFWCAYLFGLPANRAAKPSFSRRRAPKRSRPVSPEDTRAASRFRATVSRET